MVGTNIVLTVISIREIIEFGRPLEFHPKWRNAIMLRVRPGTHERIELETGELFSHFARDDKAIDAELFVYERIEEPSSDEDALWYFDEAPGLRFSVSVDKRVFNNIQEKLAAGFFPGEITVTLDAKVPFGTLEHVGDPVGAWKRWKNTGVGRRLPIAGATFSFEIVKARDESSPRTETHTRMSQIVEALGRIEKHLSLGRIVYLAMAGGAIAAAFKIWK